MTLSVIIKSYLAVNFTIPCLIRYATGEKCFGCGLTTAVTDLLKLDFKSAYDSNPLIFIVLPVLIYLFVNHWRKFFKNSEVKSIKC